jgi:hypothetical protein
VDGVSMRESGVLWSLGLSSGGQKEEEEGPMVMSNEGGESTSIALPVGGEQAGGERGVSAMSMYIIPGEPEPASDDARMVEEDARGGDYKGQVGMNVLMVNVDQVLLVELTCARRSVRGKAGEGGTRHSSSVLSHVKTHVSVNSPPSPTGMATCDKGRERRLKATTG